MNGLTYIPGSTGEKTILISGLVHGDEIVGKKVCTYMYTYFQDHMPKNNYIFFLANIEAHEANKRYIDEDMNRCREHLEDNTKTSSERKRAREFLGWLEQEDIQIDYAYDFHSTPAPTPCFAISDHIDIYSPILTQTIPYIISGLINAVPGKSLLGYLSDNGVPGIAFEPGDHTSPETITIAYQIAQDIIHMHEGDVSISSTVSSKIITIDSCYYTTNPECTLTKAFSSFDIIKAGETRCRDGEKTYIAEQEYHILIPNTDIYKLTAGGKKTWIAYLGVEKDI